MKTFVRPFGILALMAAFPAGCSTATTDLPIDDLCQQMGLDRYEFAPVADVGSFEPATDGTIAAADKANGWLIIDDDDLTDDYSIYQEGQALYHQLVDADPALQAAVDAYEASDSTDPPGTVPELSDLVDQVSVVCPYYSVFNVLPANGVAPLFTSCKDRWNDTGDGVMGKWNLATSPNPQDQRLAACTTVDGVTPNTHAINFWGPVTQRPSAEDGWDMIDGFTYSGIVVPLTSAYDTTIDLSQWEGVAFWARNASADEALPIDSDQVIFKPEPRKVLPPDPRAQDGTSQIGVMIQTVDTGAVESVVLVAFTVDSQCSIEAADGTITDGNCFADQAAYDAFPSPLVDDGTGAMVKYGLLDAHGAPVDVPQPTCIDYSPIDAEAGEEAPYRNQCWDGFRYLREVGHEWTFIFLPFSEMRQAGWGAYAPEFRIDQMRSLGIMTSAFNAINIVVDEVSYYRKKPAVPAAP